MIRILVDMNLSPGWVDRFAESGVEAQHWSTLGAAGAPDSEIMAWANDHDHVVLTHDLDFSAILAATQARAPSVVLLRMQDVFPETAFSHVLRAIRALESPLSRGAIVTVGAAGTRVRVLPLSRD